MWQRVAVPEEQKKKGTISWCVCLCECSCQSDWTWWYCQSCEQMLSRPRRTGNGSSIIAGEEATFYILCAIYTAGLSASLESNSLILPLIHFLKMPHLMTLKTTEPLWAQTKHKQSGGNDRGNSIISRLFYSYFLHLFFPLILCLISKVSLQQKNVFCFCEVWSSLCKVHFHLPLPHLHIYILDFSINDKKHM